MLADCSESATMAAVLNNYAYQEGHSLMDLKRMGILMLLLAVVCGLVAYESYRFNANAVEMMLEQAGTRDMFTKLEPGIPKRSQITGFCAIVFGVAGLKLILTKPKPKQ